MWNSVVGLQNLPVAADKDTSVGFVLGPPGNQPPDEIMQPEIPAHTTSQPIAQVPGQSALKQPMVQIKTEPPEEATEVLQPEPIVITPSYPDLALDGATSQVFQTKSIIKAPNAMHVRPSAVNAPNFMQILNSVDPRSLLQPAVRPMMINNPGVPAVLPIALNNLAAPVGRSMIINNTAVPSGRPMMINNPAAPAINPMLLMGQKQRMGNILVPTSSTQSFVRPQLNNVITQSGLATGNPRMPYVPFNIVKGKVVGGNIVLTSQTPITCVGGQKNEKTRVVSKAQPVNNMLRAQNHGMKQKLLLLQPKQISLLTGKPARPTLVDSDEPPIRIGPNLMLIKQVEQGEQSSQNKVPYIVDDIQENLSRHARTILLTDNSTTQVNQHPDELVKQVEQRFQDIVPPVGEDTQGKSSRSVPTILQRKTSTIQLNEHPEMPRKKQSRKSQNKPKVELEPLPDSPPLKKGKPTKPRPSPAGNFSCDQCLMTFTHNYRLLSHIKTHMSHKAFKCRYCGTCVSSKSYLSMHEQFHRGESSHECQICHKRFVQGHSLKDHMLTHCGKKEFACSLCDKAFRKKHQLKTHTMRHEGILPYSCSTCGKSFVTNYAMKYHMKTHDAARPHVCTVCNRRFRLQYQLIAHGWTHSKIRPHKCGQCERSFTTVSILKLHSWVHTSDRPHQCPVCPLGFSKKYSLKMHMSIHTGERPYRCSQCGKRFRLQTTLRTHQRTHNTDRPYQCSQCPRTYRTITVLRNHQRTHTGVRPFMCSVCDKAYYQSYELKQHVRNHTGERPYSCPTCNRTFTTSRLRLLHVRTHTGLHPKSCKLCGRRFRDKQTLERHLKSHSREKKTPSESKKPLMSQNRKKKHPEECTPPQVKKPCKTVRSKPVRCKPYICKYCDKAYGAASSLKIHIRIHTWKDAHRCSMCSKSFKDKDDLDFHMKFHNDERYLCTNCDIEFSRMDALKRHFQKGRCEKRANNLAQGKYVYVKKRRKSARLSSPMVRRSSRAKPAKPDNHYESDTESYKSDEEVGQTQASSCTETDSYTMSPTDSHYRGGRNNNTRSFRRSDFEDRGPLDKFKDGGCTDKRLVIDYHNGSDEEGKQGVQHATAAPTIFTNCRVCVNGFSLEDNLENHLETHHYESLWPVLSLGIPLSEALGLI